MDTILYHSICDFIITAVIYTIFWKSNSWTPSKWNNQRGFGWYSKVQWSTGPIKIIYNVTILFQYCQSSPVATVDKSLTSYVYIVILPNTRVQHGGGCSLGENTFLVLGLFEHSRTEWGEAENEDYGWCLEEIDSKGGVMVDMRGREEDTLRMESSPFLG